MESQEYFISPQVYAGVVKVESKIDESSILLAIEELTGINERLLKSKTRKREIVEARYIFFKIIRDNTRKSLAVIGEKFRKDHATVLHGLKTHENLMSYPKYKEKYKDILERTIALSRIEEPNETFRKRTIKSLYKS